MKRLSLKEGVDIQIELIKNARENPEFKKEFIKNPKQVIEEKAGTKLKLPKNVNIFVEDQTDSNVIYLNIPRKLDIDDIELSDEELETISGGTSMFTIECAVIGCAIAVITVVGYFAHGASKYDPNCK